MKPSKKLAFGIPLLVLVLILLTAGCTYPAGVPVITTTPTPTATSQVTGPVTTTPVANETLNAEMAALAETLAGSIDKEDLSMVLQEGEASTAYMAVLTQLQTFKLENPLITYDYILEQSNGTVLFVMTNYQGEPGAPVFMQEYINPPPELMTPVTTPIAIGPYTDEYGTFISGLAPVDLGLNAPVIIVGVDYQL